MKLVKLEDGYSSQHREISSNELMMRYIFSSKYPKLFVPGDYKIGDYTYVINPNGTLTIYECLKTGHYDKIDSRFWASVDINSMIKNTLSMELFELSKEDKYPVLFSYEDYTSEEVALCPTESNFALVLPTSYTEETHIDVFCNQKYIPSYEYTIEKDGIAFILTFKSYSDKTMSDEFELYMRTPDNHNAKLINYRDVHVTKDSDSVSHEIDLVANGITDSFAFFVYVDGLYKHMLSTDYTIDTTNNTLTLHNISSTSNVVVSFMFSRSKAINLRNVNLMLPVVSSVNRYRLDIDTMDTLDGNFYLFNNGKHIPTKKGYANDGILSITDEQYYGTIGDTFYVSYVVIEVDHTLVDRTFNTIKLIDTDRTVLPIPIINYEYDTHDVIVFKTSGLHVSRSRYYPKGGYINYYEHDTSLSSGESLLFQVFNEDRSMNICSKIVPYDVSNPVIEIPLKSFDPKTTSFLLFNTNGTYYSKTKYVIDGNTIKFLDGYGPFDGEELEFVFNVYNTTYTNTVTKLDTVVLGTSNEFELPLNSYDEDTYTIILFHNRFGSYIDKSRYTISENRIVRITSGTGVSAGDSVDVYVIKRFDKYIGVNTLESVVTLI